MNRTLKICFIGKYPPIEGGVSKEGYWLTRRLAERGHQVHVVTNAFEVEEAYRMYLDADDLEWMQGGARCGAPGRLVVTNSSPDGTNPRFIPETKPYVSKLAGLAMREVETHGLDLVYSYYLEPYCVAGHLCSTLMGLPHVMRHAGSDFYRLSAMDPLGRLYQRMWHHAAGIISTPDGEATMRAWGIPRERFHRGAGALMPRSHFNPAAAPLDVNAFFDRMRMVDAPFLAALMGNTVARFDPSTPTLGIYGKAGISKGTFDLVAALAILKKRGVAFNFLAMIGGTQAAAVRKDIRRSGLQDRTWFLPFLPHWKVPSFIRACTAVCFLERSFWLSHHTPGVPAEVLACGVCLVVSGEVERKHSTRSRFRNGSNVVVVTDPTDVEALARTLMAVVEDPARATAIGQRGLELSTETEDDEGVLDQHDALLCQVAAGRTVSA